MDNENLENVANEEASNELVVVNNVQDLTAFGKKSKVEVGTYTNITDKKELFNLKSHTDFMLNDCVGEKIRIKKVLVRTYDKPMRNPILDEETGEIIKDMERKVSCVIIDDTGRSYATGSKTFTYNLMSYFAECDGASELENGIEIEIIKVNTPTGNKALSFKIL